MGNIFKLIVLLTTLTVHTVDLYGQAGSQESTADTSSPLWKIEHFNQQGKDCYREGNYTDALVSFTQALHAAESIPDSLYIAKLNSNIGVIHDMIGDYGEALSHYQKSLLIYDHMNNIQGKESVLNNIGVVYEEMNMPKKALANYFRALKIKKQQGNKTKIAGTYNNIAIIYENFLNNTDSAYYFYNEALNCFTAAGDEPGIALIKSNIGIIHLRKGELDKAQTFIDQSLQLLKRTATRSDYANALYFRGKLSMEQLKTDQALNYFLQAIKLAEKYNIKKLQSRTYLDMAEIYKKQNKYQQALAAYEKHVEVKEKLIDIETVKQFHNMEMKYNLKKNEQQIALLHSQADLKSMELVWTRRSFYVLFVIAVLGVIITILNRNKNLLKQKQNLLLLQSRLFRSQTSPHFIFNSLMSIQTFLMENNVEAASKYLVDFAKLIRSILQNTRSSFVPLDQEIETLKQYLSLEKLRFSDKFSVDFLVNVSHPEEIQFPPMLSQPFIENAIVHGLLPADKPGLLKIEFTETNKTLFVIIEDNGIGRERSAMKQKNKDHKSMAIEMTKQRTRIISRRFNNKITFNIIDLKDEEGRAKGTRVVFEMALD